MKNNFEKSVLDAIDKYSMLESGDKVLVGLSGGKDSSALVHFLAKKREAFRIELAAFHLNHMIRGSEADRDAEFSEKLCHTLNVEFVKKQIDVPSVAQKSKKGLEEAARDCRYDALFETAAELGCNKIATAHTSSDNCETVLYNLIRGSGRVKGIPPVRENIIRPLIYVTSEEVIEYCKLNSIEFVYDSTNSDFDYSRNFIRGKVIPVMRALNPSLERAFMTPSEVSACDSEYFSARAEDFIKDNIAPDGSFYLDALQRLASDRKNTSLFHSLLSKLVGTALTSVQLEAARRVIVSGIHGKRTELPESLDMTVSYGRVYFVKRELPEKQNFNMRLSFGENRPQGSAFGIFMSEDEKAGVPSSKDIIYKNINKKVKKICLDWDKIKGDLYIRGRVSGDSLRAGGITRSVKKYLIDVKIPAQLRESFPIVCDGEGVVWVPGLPVCDRVKDIEGKKVYLSLVIY